MASFFDFVKAPELKKYKYDLSHEIKFSGKVGQLIPFGWEFLSPGDSVELTSQQFIRTAPLIHPIFQRLNVDVHHFFVPLRLIWDDFETFITGFDQKQGIVNEDTNHPKIILDGSIMPPTVAYALFSNPDFSPNNDYSLAISSLADYLGVPVQELPNYFGLDMEASTPTNPVVISQQHYENARLEFSALPFRAYTKIYNDYYRDSIKEPEKYLDTSSNDFVIGQAGTTDGEWSLFDLEYRALSQDYFTTSQPTPQLGEDVALTTQQAGVWVNTGTPAPSSDANMRINTQGKIYFGSNTLFNLHGLVPSTVVSTINQLRELFSIQKWRDTGNKFGSRYREQVKGHFGVDTPDARLQRPQFLGGGRIPIMINQVSQLSEGSEDSPLGYQAGQGMASGADNRVQFEALEHGIIISMISVLPENTYYRGLPKKFQLFDRFDFPWPEFATIGEQKVNSSELNLNFEDSTFGYQERYAEFKSIPSRAMGEFRTSLKDFYLASPQNQPSCLDYRNLHVVPEDYDNVFAIDSSQADNIYFLVNQEFYKYSPLPYLNRVTTDYV